MLCCEYPIVSLLKNINNGDFSADGSGSGCLYPNVLGLRLSRQMGIRDDSAQAGAHNRTSNAPIA
jgi:hypothetical protein